PAGPTASAPATRNTAGPSPRIALTPVTATIVTVPSATASWIIPERHTSPPERSAALRPAGGMPPPPPAGCGRKPGKLAQAGGGFASSRAVGSTVEGGGCVPTLGGGAPGGAGRPHALAGWLRTHPSLRRRGSR